MYYSWLKKHNHLFKHIELDKELITEFESESIVDSQQFQDNTREEDQNILSDSESEEVVDEVSDKYFEGNEIEPH